MGEHLGRHQAEEEEVEAKGKPLSLSWQSRREMDRGSGTTDGGDWERHREVQRGSCLPLAVPRDPPSPTHFAGLMSVCGDETLSTNLPKPMV